MMMLCILPCSRPDSRSILLLVAGALVASHSSFAYQPRFLPSPPNSATAKSEMLFPNGVLFYRNRTDEETGAVQTDFAMPKVALDGTVETNSDLRRRYFDLEDDVDVDNNADWYFEDGTPYVEPTLEMLKEWTMDFIDAVDLAGGMTRISVGVGELLDDEFVFTSPGVGPLNKRDYYQLMKFYRDNGLDLASAVPDLKVTYDGWHQDPHEPWRIWVVARYSGTHTGSAGFPGTALKLNPAKTPRRFITGPEMQSFLWTGDKTLLWHTMGYVGDEYTGTNMGHGGLDGLSVSMGLPHLYLEAVSPVRRMKTWLSQFQFENTDGSTVRDKTPYSRLPQWWHERKSYDMNIHK